MVRRLLWLSLLAVPVPAFAATPTAAPVAAKPAAKPPLPLAQGSRRITLSPEGRTIAQKVLSAPDPRAVQLQKDVAAARQELVRLASAPVLELDKFEAALRRDEGLASQILTLKNDRMIALLRALPPVDRQAFLQTLVNPAKPQNTPANPAP